jgi:hypothetical protein
MKTKKHNLYFPDRISVDDYLERFKKSDFNNQQLSSKGDHYIKLRLVACVSFMYISTLRSKKREVSINSKTTFRQFLGEHSSRFVNFVCSNGEPPLFCFVANYRVGKDSRKYGLNTKANYKFKPCALFEQSEIDELFSNLLRKRSEADIENRFPVPELKAFAARMTVDTSKYSEALTKYEQRKIAQNETYNLNEVEVQFNVLAMGPKHHGYFFFREDSRLYSSITNTPREFRSLLRYDGKPLIELDQCASQPFLLLRFYLEDGSPQAMAEAARYHELWNLNRNNGDFYTNLIGNLQPSERSDVKSSLINDVLNRPDYMEITNDPPRANRQQRIKETFKSQFPILFSKIDDLKTKRQSEIEIKGNRVHSQFAITLQQMESIVFIDQIAAECVERNIPIYTVHDCIGCLEENRQNVTEIAIRHLTKYCGFAPRFK